MRIIKLHLYLLWVGGLVREGRGGLVSSGKDAFKVGLLGVVGPAVFGTVLFACRPCRGSYFGKFAWCIVCL